MAFNQGKILAYLQEIGVNTETFDHPVVMTVDKQARYMSHLDGGHCKNLFLKDKKNRLYLVSALTTTTIDLKVLSQRLGLGKGGLRMAPEDTMQEVLKVPLGCVTPFALINESARPVALLLDRGFQTKSQVFFHPLTNAATTSLTTAGLDMFLRSIGREPIYVDLEAVVAIGKDHPPDLATYVPIELASLSGRSCEEVTGNISEQKASRSRENIISTAETFTTSRVLEKTIAKVKHAEKESTVMKPAVEDPQRLVAYILDQTTEAVLAEITPAAVELHGNDVGSFAANRIRNRLAPELQSIIMMFKNTAYTQGFVSGGASRSLS